MTTILVVDDEKNIVQLVRLYLTNEGFDVEVAYNGREAVDKARAVKPALIVLDLMLPEMDGWEVCRELRRDSDVPIIMLTARSDDVDKIVGLEIGADDYMAKPFNPRELVARVKAVLRRYKASTVQPRALSVGGITVDQDRREVTVAGKQVELRPKEFDLLLAFVQHPGVALSRERLLSEVWGFDYYGDSRTVDVHVAWLRDKLAGASAQIQTVWGIGYKLVVAQHV